MLCLLKDLLEPTLSCFSLQYLGVKAQALRAYFFFKRQQTSAQMALLHSASERPLALMIVTKASQNVLVTCSDHLWLTGVLVIFGSLDSSA